MVHNERHDRTCLFQRGSRPPFDDCKAAFETMPLNTWYHLTGVVEGTKSFLYVHDLKGKLIGERKLDNKSSGATLDNDSAVTIGHSVFPRHAAHSGKIAHARIYKGALSQAEIERDIISDRLAMVPFRKSLPIDFRLYDQDGQPALYIVDDSADAKIATVKLELTNKCHAIHSNSTCTTNHQCRSSSFCVALSPRHVVRFHQKEAEGAHGGRTKPPFSRKPMSGSLLTMAKTRDR